MAPLDSKFKAGNDGSVGGSSLIARLSRMTAIVKVGHSRAIRERRNLVGNGHRQRHVRMAASLDPATKTGQSETGSIGAGLVLRISADPSYGRWSE